MTGSVALDVVIGLVFIYTLYSLFTTIITEFIAAQIQMRSLFLRKAIRRMLDDDSGTTLFSTLFFHQPLIKYMASGSRWFSQRPSYLSSGNFSKNLLETLKYTYDTKVWEEMKDKLKAEGAKGSKELKEEIAQAVEDMKSTGYFSAYTLKDIIQKPEYAEKDKAVVAALEDTLSEIARLRDLPLVERILKVLRDPERDIGRSETIRHLRSLLEDAQNDMEKFRGLLEQWYDDTMERVSSWYKAWIQTITFAIGFGVAVVFNVDTIFIVRTLSKDDNARKQMVDMATAYIESHPAPQGAANACDTCSYSVKLDSLLKVKKEIEADIQDANSLLGLGWDFPDEVPLLDSVAKQAMIKKNKTLRESDFLTVSLDKNREDKKDSTHYILITKSFPKLLARRLLVYSNERFWLWGWVPAWGWIPWCKKGGEHPYLATVNFKGKETTVSLSKIKLFWTGFGGFFLTAVAISLGAPFWFDLLNKLVRLRTAVRPSAPEEEKKNPAAGEKVPAIKRVG